MTSKDELQMFAPIAEDLKDVEAQEAEIEAEVSQCDDFFVNGEFRCGKIRPSLALGCPRAPSRQSLCESDSPSRRSSMASLGSSMSGSLSWRKNSQHLDQLGIGGGTLRKSRRRQQKKDSFEYNVVEAYVDDETRGFMNDIGGNFIDRLASVSVEQPHPFSDEKEKEKVKKKETESQPTASLHIPIPGEDYVVRDPTVDFYQKLAANTSQASTDGVEEEEIIPIRPTVRIEFSQFDENQDGNIDFAEMKKQIAATAWGKTLTDAQLRTVLRTVDHDRNEMLDKYEFEMFAKLLQEATAAASGKGGDFVAEWVTLLGGREKRKRYGYKRVQSMMKMVPRFSPESSFSRWWDFVVLFLVLYHLMACTTVALVLDELPMDLFYCDMAAVVLHVADMVVSMISPYRKTNQTRLVIDRRKLIARYWKKHAWIDLITALPIDSLVYLLGGSAVAWKVLRMKNLIFSLKLHKILKIHATGVLEESHVQFFFVIIPLVSQLWKMLIVGHILISVRMMIVKYETLEYLIGEPPTDPNTTGSANMEYWDRHDTTCSKIPDMCAHTFGEQYFLGAFWIWGYLTSEGPIVIGLNSCILAVLLMGVSLLIQSHILALISSILLNRSIQERNFNNMSVVMNTMEYFGVPSTLQQEVLSFNFHSLDFASGKAVMQLMVNMPAPIVRELFLYIKVSVIESVAMFHSLESECILALANCLEQKYATPSEKIIKIGTQGREMYFLMYGYAEVIAEDDGVLYTVAVLVRGDLFGEISLLQPNCPRTATVEALTYCDLFMLNVSDFNCVQSRFQTLKLVVMQEARKRGIFGKTTLHTENLIDDMSSLTQSTVASPRSPRSSRSSRTQTCGTNVDAEKVRSVSSTSSSGSGLRGIPRVHSMGRRASGSSDGRKGSRNTQRKTSNRSNRMKPPEESMEMSILKIAQEAERERERKPPRAPLGTLSEGLRSQSSLCSMSSLGSALSTGIGGVRHDPQSLRAEKSVDKWLTSPVTFGAGGGGGVSGAFDSQEVRSFASSMRSSISQGTFPVQTEEEVCCC